MVRARRGAGRLLVARIPAFGLLWTGQLLSATGTWLMIVAVPLYVLHLTGSARDTGLAFAAEVVPALLIGPLAGVLADRLSYRLTMISSDLVRAASVAGMAFVRRPGELGFLLVAVFAENAAGAFFSPAHSGLLPAVVGRGRDLDTANAWYSLSSGVVRLIGAPAGGAVYLTAGFTATAAIDAASYLASAALVAAMPVLAAETRRTRARFVSELRQGFGAVRADRMLRVLLLVSGLFLLGNGALTALFVPYVVSGLRARPDVVGVLFSALGAGFLLSGWIGRYVCRARRLRVAVVALLAGATVAFCGFFDWHKLAADLLFIGLVGATGGGFLMVRQTLLQRRADPAVIGRVSACFTTAEMAATLAGAGLASLAVSRAGLAVTLNAAIAVVAVAAALALWLPAEPPRPAAVRRATVQPLAGRSVSGPVRAARLRQLRKCLPGLRRATSTGRCRAWRAGP